MKRTTRGRGRPIRQNRPGFKKTEKGWIKNG